MYTPTLYTRDRENELFASYSNVRWHFLKISFPLTQLMPWFHFSLARQRGFLFFPPVYNQHVITTFLIFCSKVSLPYLASEFHHFSPLNILSLASPLSPRSLPLHRNTLWPSTLTLGTSAAITTLLFFRVYAQGGICIHFLLCASHLCLYAS